MRHPALVFIPELVRSIDAAHPENSGLEAIAFAIIEYILIGRSLGTAIGTVKYQWLFFRDTMLTDGRIFGCIAGVFIEKSDLVKVAIYFVGRSENQRWLMVTVPDRFQHIDRKSTRLNSSHVAISY